MDGPRGPVSREEQLPDALDQTPDAHQGTEHGSEDAQLLAEAEEDEGDVEQGGSS